MLRTVKDRALNEKQHAAIRLLMQGSNHAHVAEQIGTTPETLSRWMNNDTLFIATLNYQRQAAYESVIQRMRSLAHAAVDALETGLESDDENIRLKTAQTILKMISLDHITPPEGPITEHDVVAQQNQNNFWNSFQPINM
jgi:transposase-like protein